ncbi:TraB domain-containing protein [Seminavis robusta]|uniref:TraB domain-containing protein n=1 Tax=Seminavis robusta TaxID=568900 RepID=A0A9N8H440_9STRA|nr:TraB domain-containing protein [Seminavis robusta]|eukprot:Sro40_g024790.1 TraB domain-containing protein (448) ;mRNA; f:100377-101720
MKRTSRPRSLIAPQWLLAVSLPFLALTQARAPWINHAQSALPLQRHWWGRVTRGGSSISEANRHAETISSDTTSTEDNTHQSNNNDTHSQSNATTTAANQTIVEAWKQELPPPLCFKSTKTLQRICVPYQNHVAEIYLLGTAHVSNDSSRDVKLLLETLHPDVIFVELCEQRTALMEDPPDILLPTNNNNTNDDNTTTTKLSFSQKVKELQRHTQNSKLQCMATVLLTSTQEEYAESLGVELGGEFRVAYQYWRSMRTYKGQRRPHLILGDRPLAITLARCWESLSFFGKIKVLIGLLLSSFHKPSPEELRAWIQKIMDDETDLLSSSLEELRRHFPSLERVIIQERDAYMACKLYQLCRGMLVSAVKQQQQQQPSYGGDNRIVIAALVGAGHVPGICAWLTTKDHPEGPEAILDGLIATKKFANEDLSPLVYDVTELQDMPQSQQQ